MYADGKDEITIDQFHELVYAVYKLAMDHYPEGPQSCRFIFMTIKALVESAVSNFDLCPWNVRQWVYDPQNVAGRLLGPKMPSCNKIDGPLL